MQLPVDNPSTGHSIKRTRTDDETQYQYRKRRIEEHRQEPVHQEQEDPRIEKALNVKNVIINADYYENEQGILKENISREERYNGRTGKKSTHGG